MNERIKQLAEQATIWEGMEDGYIFDKEKFAELIVKECAGVGYDASYYECALNVSNKIKEHFGVEE
jgi:hypothetical protein